MKNKILITGVAGLVGSYLAEKCLDEGEEVVGIDNFFRGSMRNLENVSGNRRFTFIEDDIINIGKLDLNGVGRIYHLAAIVPTKYFYSAPVETFNVNCYATKLMIEWAVANGVEKFVNASSSEIYGHPQQVPTPEQAPSFFDPVEKTARWSYALGKLMGEHIGNHYKNIISICHLRYANVYGPRDIDPEHVIPYIISKVLDGEKIVLNRNASRIRRTFLYATDCAVATRLAMDKSPSGVSFNIGATEEISICELASMIFEIAGSRSDVEYSLERPGDPSRRLLDIGRAKETLGFVPSTPLREGVRKTFEWMKKLHDRA